MGCPAVFGSKAEPPRRWFVSDSIILGRDPRPSSRTHHYRGATAQVFRDALHDPSNADTRSEAQPAVTGSTLVSVSTVLNHEERLCGFNQAPIP